MGKKAQKIKELKKKIAETHAVLEELQEEYEELLEKRQHKRVDKLEKALRKSEKRESLPELSTEAMQEFKNLLGGLFDTVKFWEKDEDDQKKGEPKKDPAKKAENADPDQK